MRRAPEHGNAEAAPSLTLGRWILEPRSDDDAWCRLAWDRYAGFEAQAEDSSADTRERIVVRYRVVSGAPSLAELHRARAVPLRGRRDRETLTLEGEGFRAHLDLACARIEIDGPQACYPLDLVLRAFVVEADRGLVLHSAAVARHGRGWLLTGPSGVGKSTFAALFPRRALCDEMAAIRWIRGRATIVSLPFWHGRPATEPLAAVLCLRHADRHRREALSRTEAFARLRDQVLWPTWCSESVERTVDRLARLVETVPVDELFFRPEPSVWNQLEGEGRTNRRGAA